MLAIVGLLFGSVFTYQIVKSKMIKHYMMQGANPAVTVSAMKAELQNWQPKVQAIGTLRAARGVDVTSEVTGIVRSIEFRSGKRVKKGDLLITLNDDSEQADLASLMAEANLAQQNVERDKAQYKIKAVSQVVVETSLATLRSKKAQIDAQKARIAKKNIRAPFSGKLGITTVNPGQYINPGDKIVTLQALDPIFVDFNLPEQYFAKLKIGDSVVLKSSAYPNQKFSGAISAIDPKVDPATRNIQVEAKLRNIDDKLIPGMFTEVEIILGEAQPFLTLPQTAISFNPYGEIAFVIRNNIATQTFVKVGERRGDQVAVLEGIKVGDLVVTSGQLKLKNGSKVTINNKVQPANNPNPAPVDE